MQGAPSRGGDFLVPWMRIAEPARHAVLARASTDPQADCERESIRLSLANLRTFPWITERVDAGQLTLTGAIFDIRSGVLAKMQADGTFVPV